MKRVMLTETEKWRLVTERLTRVLTLGFWSMNISSREDRQERPRNETESVRVTNYLPTYLLNFRKSHELIPLMG